MASPDGIFDMPSFAASQAEAARDRERYGILTHQAYQGAQTAMNQRAALMGQGLQMNPFVHNQVLQGRANAFLGGLGPGLANPKPGDTISFGTCKPNRTIREELQADVDEWLEGVI
jgi:hypothetical protein